VRLPPFGSLAPFGFLAAAVLSSAFLGPVGSIEAKGQEAPAEAQAPAETSAADEAVAAAEPIPFGRYMARDQLFLSVEFAGLDSRADAWKQTAAHRMLNETSLGVMLRSVGSQLADRLIDHLPNRKIGGIEAVVIIEQLARKGWALGLGADPQAPNHIRGVLVLRGMEDKEMRSLFSRLMGTFMADEVKPKIERKGSRVMVVVPPRRPKKDVDDQGWVWWPEGEDLVVGLFQPSDADSVHAALDGQAPSLEGYEPIADLAKPEEGFTPVLTAWFDPVRAGAVGGAGEGEGNPLAAVAKFFEDSGVKRVDHRWGFDGESLMSVTRLTAPKPRKGILALFNDPSFEAKNILPVPDGVDYFASVSIKPDQWPEILAAALGSGEGRAEFDAFVEELRGRRVEFDKDLLGNLGPRALFYLAPGGSAATPAAAPGADLLPAPLAAAFASRIPRPVLVTEVVDPPKFGRALETLMFEVNSRIKAAAIEQAAAIAKAEADAQRAGAGDGIPGAPGVEPGAQRGTRRREAEPPVPEFRLIPGSTSASERIYMLNIPTNSPIKPFPPGVKPTIRLEGTRLALSTSPEAARTAIELLRDKEWTPSADIADALAKTPDNSVFVLYGDSRETTPTILASLPGTLQAQINMAIAMAARGAESSQDQDNFAGRPGGPRPGGPGMPLGPGGPGMPLGPGGPGMSRGPGGPGSSALGPGGPGMSRGPGGPGSGMPASPGGRPGGQASAAPALMRIQVRPDQLPKADELKAFMFPTSTSVVVDDETVRIVTREAFPDAIALATANGALAAILVPAINAAQQAAQGPESDAEEGGEGAPGGQPGLPSAPGPGPALAPGGGIPAPGAPGAPGGRVHRRDEQ